MRLKHLLAAGAACLCLSLPVSAWTQRSAADGAERLEVRRGQSAVVEADAAFATIVVADAHFWLGWLAAKSCCKRFGAMLNVWSLSVVALNLWVLTTQIAFCRIKRPTRR